MLEFIRSYPAVPVLVVLVGGVAVWHVWEFRIRPLFIPKPEIDAVVDALIEKHGPDAEDWARGYEEEGWYRSDTYLQGKWRRVRRELWRRYEAGEWD
ncbi:hypothetical protein [Pelagibacterium xiamenense]|uniref:hypothetical protein n=1 Tax=Pelagibacterium xiamenense TaxID=2901140 RepID=UPI001E5C97D8|nr:hypothetical protein [Pelagibacterium xiamenense]MCD7059120.1 hypothetical protein [Pelagibacterium xiamenense]